MFKVDGIYLRAITYPIAVQLDEMIDNLVALKDNDDDYLRLVDIVYEFDKIHENARKAISEYLDDCGYKLDN